MILHLLVNISFKFIFNLDLLGLKKGNKYICDYRLIKECTEEVLNTINSKFYK